MKLRVRKTKTGVTISINASKKGDEGKDLATAVLSSVGRGRAITLDVLASVLGSLQEQGYTAEGLIEGEMPTVVTLSKGSQQ